LKFNTRLVLFAIALLGLMGCGRDTSFKKFYHNTTAHFNGYFNALTKYEEAMQDIRNQHKDEFMEVIPVYVYGSPAAAANFYPQFDEVIKKCSNVIQNHEISNWIDDCFLLIGKAYFMKREYFEAIESFQYVYTRWKREPIADEALLWLIRAYTASGQYAKAQGGIDLIISNKNFPTKYKGELQALRAELYLTQKRYDQAVEPLLQVQKYKFPRYQQARFHFILGQIYTKTNPRLAGAEYRASLKRKPYYEMQFQARMNLARLYDGKNVTAKQAKKQLNRLLRDEKNKEYFDEIYYELAMLAFKDRDAALGIGYLKASTANSTKNTRQKAKSYLALAELYFKQAEYVTSQAYYDSTYTVIEKEHPKYKEVQGKKDYLGELVKNLDVITEQDSLLKLAALPESQLHKIIDKAIKEERRKKDQERFEKENANNNPSMAPGQSPGTNRGGGGPGGSEWYFYNQQVAGLGYSQFLQQWGNRELSDNWRRSKKEKALAEGSSGSDGGDGSNIDSDESFDPTDPRGKYLARIPRTEENKQKSKVLIQQALFNLGAIYREKLDDYGKSIGYYEQLLKSYPGYEKEDEALYRLGLVHELVNAADKKTQVHNRLTTEYPESNFSKLLLNPASLSDSTSSGIDNQACEKLYNTTYAAYQKGDVVKVVAQTQEAIAKYPDHALMPNFEFMAAMCKGKAADTTAMVSALTALIARYPQHEISKLAQELVDMMDPRTRDELLGKADKEIFQKKPEDAHYYILAMELRVFNQNKEIQLKLANFNDSNFKNNRMRITTMLYGKEYQLLVVRELPNERKAVEYLAVAQANKDLLTGLPEGKYLSFIAAKDNFNDLYKNNQLREYMLFFDKNYANTKK
jgi:tetratricopeptide (TPR) repeat protein